MSESLENQTKCYYENLNNKNRRKYRCLNDSSAELFRISKLCLLLIIQIIILNISAVNCMYEEYRKPTYLEGRVGSFVVFNCHIEFPQEDHPIPYILNWKKDGKLIFTWFEGSTETFQNYTGRITLAAQRSGLGKGSINITSIRDTDSGWYECRTFFPNRTPSSRINGTFFHLAVDGGTLLKIPPMNQTVLEHESAFFHCSVKNPDTMFVEWFKDNKPLIEFHDLASRTVMGSDGSLMIGNTLMSDLGEYKCIVKNSINEQEEAKAFLNVEYKAKVVYAPEKIYLPFGKPAIIDCHFRSNPELTNLRWEKDGFLYDPYNVQGVFYRPNGSLYFNKVDDSHAGKYSCTPYNKLGTQGASPIISVIVQHPPEFTIKPNSIYVCKLGDTVQMHCSARDSNTNDDRALIAWSRKDGLALPFNRHTVDAGNLTIENVVADDRGIYTCTAINEAAKVSFDTELLIESVSPKAPSNLNANSSQDAITLRWTPNYIRPDLRYFVWYRLSDAQEWRTHQVFPVDIYETTIENLEPGREYEFMVLCQDRYQDGMFSKAYRYMTKPKEYQELFQFKNTLPFSQIGPPRNITIELEEGRYLVSWAPPDYGYDILSLYIVEWYLEPEHKLIDKVETKNNYHSKLLSDLDDDKLYSVVVLALSSNDYKAAGEQIEIVTPAFRRMQAITVGTTVGLLVLVLLVGITLYLKRHLFSSYHNEEKV